ncbi:WXG100 family type VII secretion target [Nocardioides alkalitolerans]|uniref:WXG100 family type VII secretion target n=1 Tax=Nocardioides alkalitolerans TaxID=281714 RepID=UPI000400210D|nr:WXG100 family type VII secretion target [Nocardioides alkalitolerans]
MSDGSGLTVDHGTLEATAQDLVAAARQIEARLDRLEQELAPLRSEWSGNAQEAYVRAKAIWDQEMTRMIELLQATSNSVTNSNAEYRAADRRGADRFPA